MTKQSAYHATANRVYSHSTLIRQMLPNGLTIGNRTYYSSTTSRHQNKANVEHCHVVLENVPKDCDDLLALAIERGEVVRYSWQSSSMPAPAYEYQTRKDAIKHIPNLPRVTIF